MDITIFDVIKRPYISTKAYGLNHRHQQLVLEVHMSANKPLIAEALKKIFNVEAEKIRIIVSKGKNKRVGRYSFTDSDRKKAIVTLKRGYSVDMMGLETANASTTDASEQAAQ